VLHITTFCQRIFWSGSGLRNTGAIRRNRDEEAVFLGFGFVSVQSQATAGMLLHRSLAKTQKSSLRTATLFLKTLLSGNRAHPRRPPLHPQRNDRLRQHPLHRRTHTTNGHADCFWALALHASKESNAPQYWPKSFVRAALPITAIDESSTPAGGSSARLPTIHKRSGWLD